MGSSGMVDCTPGYRKQKRERKRERRCGEKGGGDIRIVNWLELQSEQIRTWKKKKREIKCLGQSNNPADKGFQEATARKAQTAKISISPTILESHRHADGE